MRPSWDEYFLEITFVVAKRSTCLRRHVGALIVKDRQIVSTGYNGVPSGLVHCGERGCIRDQLQIPSGQRAEICRAVHAEQNAMIQAARHGTSVEGAALYVTTQPCVLCTKLAINAGIRRIVYRGEYPDQMSVEMLAEAGVELVRLA